MCPARKKREEDYVMSHVIKPKKSNYVTPNHERDAQFVWAPGAKPHPKAQRANRSYFVLTALVVAVAVGVLAFLK